MKKVLLIDYAKYTGPDGQATYNHKLIKIFQQLGGDITHFSFGINENAPDINTKFSDIHSITSDYYNHHKYRYLSIMRLLKIQKYGMKQLVNHLENNTYDLIIDSIQFTWKFARHIPSNNKIGIQHQSCNVLDYSQAFGKFGCHLFYGIAKHLTHYFANIETTHNAVVYTKYDLEKINQGFNKQISKSGIIPLSYEVNKKTIPISYSNRKRAILFVGRLDLHQKRIKFLIDLSKHLDFDIHVFGDGDLIETVKQNPNRIKYMGVFNKQNASEIYKEYLFTILVSKFEGFSFALVESLCNGTPIITTDSFDSAQFLVNNGANGLLLNHKDGVFKMAKTINNYIKQIAVNDYYHTLTNNAAEFSRSKLDDKIFTANGISLIEEWSK